MDTIVTIISVVTLLISTFFLMELSYNKLTGREINGLQFLKYSLLFTTGIVLFLLPANLGLLFLLFLILFISLIKMVLLTNKLSKQLN
ncbi:MAG TPA: hypothetical protein PLX60_13245 [Chitinophagales bacterium]|nr:hypothetical protein [Chitinophagales bacterium]HOY42829.1 hypothetical protein [Chitinophagales bacterium]HPH87533.1 hypothetical protein [Chitinophagales bacterium]